MNQLLTIACLILYFIAPVVQLILSGKRLKNRIKLPIGAITAIMLVAGIVLCIAATNLIIYSANYNREPSDRIKCITGPVGFAIMMIFINIIATLFIGIISYAMYCSKRKKLQHQLT
jgi:heme/copper-type cytochrome/quinol oxidase subunit 2